MSFLQSYDLILFDFDGLLVNTEHLHFQAYQVMCAKRGVFLEWDFMQYCQRAHTSSDGIQKEIYRCYPALYQQEPHWAVLYEEKKKAYQALLISQGVQLMPGVADLLEQIQTKNIRSVVVTNSFLEQIKQIRQQISLLEAIPYWVTREDYEKSKPAPDPYLTALKKYKKPQDRVIGFEDTLRGWQALSKAGLKGVVVSNYLTPEQKESFHGMGVECVASFLQLL